LSNLSKYLIIFQIPRP